MAKTNAPFLSFNGSGAIAKTMVASKWRGISYMRKYVVPANPQTAEQTITRSTFAYLREMWKLAPSIIVAPWDAFAKGRPFTGMNKFVGENLRVIRDEPDMNNFIFSPGAGGGLPPATAAAVTGADPGEIDVSCTGPTPPSGWTLVGMQAAAFPDADPTGIFSGPFIAAEDLVAPYALTLEGLGTAIDCQVGIWLKWQKPNGAYAYSVGQTFQATSGA